MPEVFSPRSTAEFSPSQSLEIGELTISTKRLNSEGNKEQYALQVGRTEFDAQKEPAGYSMVIEGDVDRLAYFFGKAQELAEAGQAAHEIIRILQDEYHPTAQIADETRSALAS